MDNQLFNNYELKDIPDEILENYNSWKPVHDEYVRYGNKCLEIYQNDVEGTHTNYTRKQFDAIKRKTNIPVTINYLYPAVVQKLALMCLTKPTTKVVSFDGRYKDYAQILDKCNYAVLRNSSAYTQTKARIKDSLLIGMGHEMAIPSDFFSKGEFGVSNKYQPVENVILDINSKDESGQDAEGFFIEKKLTLPRAVKIYGHIFAGLKNADGTPADPKTISNFIQTSFGDITTRSAVRASKNEGIVYVREYYDKVFSTMYLYEDTNGTVNRMFKENMSPEDHIILDRAIDKKDDIFVRRQLMFGDKLVYTETLPITSFPIVTSYFEWGGSPYKSYGMVHYALGMQQAYDKIIQLMIQNGILQNNPNKKAAKGNIAPEDRPKWEAQGNDPTVIKEYVPVELNGQVFVPETDQVQPLSNFYPMILQMMKEGIDVSTGINGMMQGNPTSEKIEVFSTLQQYQSAAMQRIQFAIENLNPSNEQLGTVTLEYIIANLKPDQMFYFFDDKGKLNELKIAKEMAMDIHLGTYKVMAIPGTIMPSQRLATSNTLASIAQSSPDPMTRNLLTNKAMELTDIPEMDGLLEQIDTVNQLNSKVEQLEKTVKQLEYENQKMESLVVQTKIENKVLTGAHKAIDSITTAQAKTEKDMEIDKLKNEAENSEQ